MTTSYPRQSARTRRFTLGVPRGFHVAPDGSRVAFLRTRAGTDPVTCLWTVDLADGQNSGGERLVADPRELDVTEEDLPPEERARRERAREQAGGIVGYATDRDVTLAAFSLSGRLFVAALTGKGGTGAETGAGAGAETGAASGSSAVRPLPSQTPVFDPRPDPTGRHVAYVCGRTLRVIGVDGAADRAVIGPAQDGPDPQAGEKQVSYGLAEFIAAEEMQRMRGYWWAPDGEALLVCRVDESPVRRWHIADPANPGRPPVEVAYPAAGTPNADVGLVVCGLAGDRTPVEWDREAFTYLVTAHWNAHALLIVVQSRDQRTMRVLAVEPATGATRLVQEDADPDWLEIVPGVPAFTGSGELVWTRDDREADTRRLVIGSAPVTPAGLQVRSVLGVSGDSVLFTASEEPAEVHVWAHDARGTRKITEGSGVFTASGGGAVTVVSGSALDCDGIVTRVLCDGSEVARIASRAETPSITPVVEMFRAGEREIRTAVLFPAGHVPGSRPLPVLLDPYGGPHAQRVLSSGRAYGDAQWLADHGFAVVIADGRGTPGRGLAWERAVRGNFPGPVLEDQISALREAARRHPDLDLARVGVRGWSFGGWLAALAVLRRPDVFHAAVAGAPVTDWTLYDTHYTERYLGLPDQEPENYERCSLLADAPRLDRPLLLIHGLADDNVVVAHTLRLSAALLEAGRPHSVLPLSGVTHMTPQEVVAENLLLLQVDFLKRALGVS